MIWLKKNALRKKVKYNSGAKANKQAEDSSVRLQMPPNDKKVTWDATVFNEENCPGISASHRLCCVRFVWPNWYVTVCSAQERETQLRRIFKMWRVSEKMLPFSFRKASLWRV